MIETKEKKLLRKRMRYGQLKGLIIFIATSILLLLLWNQKDVVLASPEYGYIGIFIINFISSASIFFPLPGTASVFFGGAILNPIFIGLVSAFGATAGELFGYLLGYGSKELLLMTEKAGKWVKQIEYFFQKAGFITITLYSALPLPLFDIVGIISGTLNYPIWKFILATLIGRIIKYVIIASVGYSILPN